VLLRGCATARKQAAGFDAPHVGRGKQRFRVGVLPLTISGTSRAQQHASRMMAAVRPSRPFGLDAESSATLPARAFLYAERAQRRAAFFYARSSRTKQRER
jgi:hypothetical protein